MTKSTRPPLDPWALLGALERHHVSYVLVGDLAVVIQGGGGIADDVEISPSLRPDNLDRLREALVELGGRDVAMEDVVTGGRAEYETPAGTLVVTAEPVGSRGYDDLRRAASREAIGRGVKPNVVSLGDLIRLADASGEPAMEARSASLRQVAELGHEFGIEL
jgi:hypothetical protein